MNRTYGGFFGILLFAAMIIGGCATGISEHARSRVTYGGTFEQLQRQPEKYTGETVMWGGKIVKTQPGAGYTELVVVQLDLGGQDRPQDNDKSQGRFLAHSAQFLDPALFPPGTLITVVGQMRGAEKRLIGQMDYQYPVIDIVEVKKWPPSNNESPRFQFGVGVGTHF